MQKSMFNTPFGNRSLREILVHYLRYWKWFLLSIIAMMGIAFVYLRYSIPKYQANAIIQVVEEKGTTSQLNLFSDLGILPGASKKVNDEIEFLRSRSNFIQVVQNLELDRKLFEVGKVKNTEIYGIMPLNINFIPVDSLAITEIFSCYIEPISETTFRYWTNKEPSEKTFTYGDNIDTPQGTLVLLPAEGTTLKGFTNKKLLLEILSVEETALAYQAALKTAILDKFSSIITLSLQDPVPQKAIDILNELIMVYNFNGKNDKKIIADKTAEFIDERIANIYNDLSQADQSAEDFKSGRGLTDIQSQSNINLNVSAANQKELQNSRIQLEIAQSVSDVLEQQQGYDILPPNLGLTDPTIMGTTERYNQLVLQRERLLKSSNEKNPVIVNIDEQLQSLSSGLKSSLNNTIRNLNLKVDNLSAQMATLNSKIYSTPRNERALREITRKQQTVEGLYLYLLQKREEAQITYASASPNSKVVDAAFLVSRFPISPKKKIIVLAFLLIGLLVPATAIYGTQLIDDKIHNAQSLEELEMGVPILGEMPKIQRKAKTLVGKNDRSMLSEALRVIRTNLDYLLRQQQTDTPNRNVIYITSSIPEEGKTFFASNLAIILAATGKKTLLVGADIRNPKFEVIFDRSKRHKKSRKVTHADKGLTDFLRDSSVNIADIVVQRDINESVIDILYTGKALQNPTETLMNSRFGDLIAEASENYDYILVDTAPMMPVSDTLLISDFADMVVYVTRAGKTSVKTIDFPLKLQKEGKINNLAFIVNGVNIDKLGYGGQYGYGYVQKHQKPWWKL